MKDIYRFMTIDEYNKAMGVETLHPLVTVIDFSKINYKVAYPPIHSFGYYAIFLEEKDCNLLKYGRNYYDYQQGTLLFFAPNQVVNIKNRKQLLQPKGWTLMFHPDIIRASAIARAMKEYTFFEYEMFEALHISEQERAIVMECLCTIESELSHSIDKYSQKVIVSNIERLLSNCSKFYDRQFIIRSHINSDVSSRIKILLNDYFSANMLQKCGLPTVKYCADKLKMSPSYLSDLLKKETGKNAEEHIQLYLMELAKEKLLKQNNTVHEISYELGFETPSSFNNVFKKCTGMTPSAYRTLNDFRGERKGIHSPL